MYILNKAAITEVTAEAQPFTASVSQSQATAFQLCKRTVAAAVLWLDTSFESSACHFKVLSKLSEVRASLTCTLIASRLLPRKMHCIRHILLAHGLL
jgi:hypothetical protein